MTSEELLRLLAQQEGPTLEFKRELPDLGDAHQRDELVKDIPSLANGNVSAVGKQAHLIWGADDAGDTVGKRACYDVGRSVDAPTFRDRIVHVMRAACNPPLDDLQCDTVAVGDARVVVLTIPVSQHVHETTRELTVKAKDKKRGRLYSKVYTKHIVFMRVGATIDIAAASDRDALRERKQRHFNESKKVSPVFFAAGLGALVGGLADPDDGPPPTLPARIISGLMGSGIGALLGIVYRQGVNVWREMENVEQIPRAWRGPMFIGYMIAAGGVARRVAKWRQQKQR